MMLRDLDNSIIRRSVILLSLVVPAYGMNFLFLVISGRLFETKAFGIFYTALSLINILISPTIILNLFFARRITLASIVGSHAAIGEFRYFVGKILRWGIVIALSVSFLMLLLSSTLHIESSLIVIMIVLTSYSIYFTESTRAALQGLKKFTILGIETVTWTSLRFILGISGILLIGTPWSGLLGIFLSSLAVFIFFYCFLINKYSDGTGSLEKAEAIDTKSLIWFCTSYMIFICIMYLDNMVAFVVFDRFSLGIYSKACILSKSIILLTTPVIQVFFPVMVDRNAKNQIGKVEIGKSFALTLLISGTISSFVCLFPDFIGNDVLGMDHTHTKIIMAVSLSAVPLCCLRILILLQLSRGFDRHPLWILPFLMMQMILLFSLGQNPVHFAWAFTIFCWGIFVCDGFICASGTMGKLFWGFSKSRG